MQWNEISLISEFLLSLKLFLNFILSSFKLSKHKNKEENEWNIYSHFLFLYTKHIFKILIHNLSNCNFNHWEYMIRFRTLKEYINKVWSYIINKYEIVCMAWYGMIWFIRVFNSYEFHYAAGPKLKYFLGKFFIVNFSLLPIIVMWVGEIPNEIKV